MTHHLRKKEIVIILNLKMNRAKVELIKEKKLLLNLLEKKMIQKFVLQIL
jgi:hypothetical protein